jgi:hypothetical protein
MCFVITVTMVMLLRNFGLYVIIFMSTYVYCFIDFPAILDTQLFHSKTRCRTLE